MKLPQSLELWGTKRRFQGAALFAWISSPEGVPRSNLHSEEIPTEARNWSGQNYPGYRNPEMDALLAKHGIKDVATRADEKDEAYLNRITAHVTEPHTLLMKLMQLNATPGTKPSEKLTTP